MENEGEETKTNSLDWLKIFYTQRDLYSEILYINCEWRLMDR